MRANQLRPRGEVDTVLKGPDDLSDPLALWHIACSWMMRELEAANVVLGHAFRNGDTWGSTYRSRRLAPWAQALRGRWRKIARIQPKDGAAHACWAARQTIARGDRLSTSPTTRHYALRYPHSQRRHRFDGRDGQGMAITTHRSELGHSGDTLYPGDTLADGVGQKAYARSSSWSVLGVHGLCRWASATVLEYVEGALVENRHGTNAVNQTYADRPLQALADSMRAAEDEVRRQAEELQRKLFKSPTVIEVAQ